MVGIWDDLPWIIHDLTIEDDTWDTRVLIMDMASFIGIYRDLQVGSV